MLFIIIFLFLSGCVSEERVKTNVSMNASSDCISLRDVETSPERGKCYIIYENDVYDLTNAPGWSPEKGHMGRYPCGKRYTKEEICAGPHCVEVLPKYFYKPLCRN